MAKPVVGAQLYTLREFARTIEDVRVTLKRVADIGYTTVQVSGFGPVDPAAVAEAAAAAGVRIVATHVGWPRFLNDLDAVIDEHKLWDCHHAAIGGLGGEYFSLEGLTRFVTELQPVTEKLAAAGMDFSYHNHNHELAHYEGRTWLARLYDTASPDVLKAEIDTYWIAAGGGDPAQWIRRYPGRQPLLHLKDMIVTPDREQRFAPIGEGNLNWPEIFAAAEAAGVDYMLVEQDNCYGGDPFAALASSYRYLQEMGYK